MEIAAPTLVHLSLEAKGLTQNKTETSAQGDIGLLSFGRFFGNLFMPCLVEFQLCGWIYGQDEMENFLLRHKSNLRKLWLFDNRMTQGDVASLDGFVRGRLELLGIEISSCL